MTDKQRADHVQAHYWNGFITRTEAQDVFNKTASVITQQGIVLQKMDAVISCVCEKLGIGVADIEAWVASKVAQAETTEIVECLCEAKDGVGHAQACILYNKRKAEEVAQAGEKKLVTEA